MHETADVGDRSNQLVALDHMSMCIIELWTGREASDRSEIAGDLATDRYKPVNILLQDRVAVSTPCLDVIRSRKNRILYTSSTQLVSTEREHRVMHYNELMVLGIGSSPLNQS